MDGLRSRSRLRFDDYLLGPGFLGAGEGYEQWVDMVKLTVSYTYPVVRALRCKYFV